MKRKVIVCVIISILVMSVASCGKKDAAVDGVGADPISASGAGQVGQAGVDVTTLLPDADPGQPGEGTGTDPVADGGTSDPEGSNLEGNDSSSSDQKETRNVSVSSDAGNPGSGYPSGESSGSGSNSGSKDSGSSGNGNASGNGAGSGSSSGKGSANGGSSDSGSSDGTNGGGNSGASSGSGFVSDAGADAETPDNGGEKMEPVETVSTPAATPGNSGSGTSDNTASTPKTHSADPSVITFPKAPC